MLQAVKDLSLMSLWFFLGFHSEPDKHYLMYEHERVPIAVCEKEPSSIIAFALRWVLSSLSLSLRSPVSVLLYLTLLIISLCLHMLFSCKEYKTSLDDLSKMFNTGGDEAAQVIRWVGVWSIKNLRCLKCLTFTERWIWISLRTELKLSLFSSAVERVEPRAAQPDQASRPRLSRAETVWTWILSVSLWIHVNLHSFIRIMLQINAPLLSVQRIQI